MSRTKIMGHSWSCPICGELFRRESHVYDHMEKTIEARARARNSLQWDAINHLATHIMNNLSEETKNGE